MTIRNLVELIHGLYYKVRTFILVDASGSAAVNDERDNPVQTPSGRVRYSAERVAIDLYTLSHRPVVEALIEGQWTNCTELIGPHWREVYLDLRRRQKVAKSMRKAEIGRIQQLMSCWR